MWVSSRESILSPSSIHHQHHQDGMAISPLSTASSAANAGNTSTGTGYFGGSIINTSHLSHPRTPPPAASYHANPNSPPPRPAMAMARQQKQLLPRPPNASGTAVESLDNHEKGTIQYRRNRAQSEYATAATSSLRESDDSGRRLPLSKTVTPSILTDTVPIGCSSSASSSTGLARRANTQPQLPTFATQTNDEMVEIPVVATVPIGPTRANSIGTIAARRMSRRRSSSSNASLTSGEASFTTFRSTLTGFTSTPARTRTISDSSSLEEEEQDSLSAGSSTTTNAAALLEDTDLSHRSTGAQRARGTATATNSSQTDDPPSTTRAEQVIRLLPPVFAEEDWTTCVSPLRLSSPAASPSHLSSTQLSSEAEHQRAREEKEDRKEDESVHGEGLGEVGLERDLPLPLQISLPSLPPSLVEPFSSLIIAEAAATGTTTTAPTSTVYVVDNEEKGRLLVESGLLDDRIREQVIGVSSLADSGPTILHSVTPTHSIATDPFSSDATATAADGDNDNITTIKTQVNPMTKATTTTIHYQKQVHEDGKRHLRGWVELDIPFGRTGDRLPTPYPEKKAWLSEDEGEEEEDEEKEDEEKEDEEKEEVDHDHNEQKEA